MELIAAIDMCDQKIVRLHQGDYAQRTHFELDPISYLKRFEQAGGKRVHIVDLNAAKQDAKDNRGIIEQIVKHSSLEIQVAGGVRYTDAVTSWLSAGASRVVVGTAAVRDPMWVESMCQQYPKQVVIAIDGRVEQGAEDGLVSIQGWLEESTLRISSLAKQADGWGAAAILFTNIVRDGTGEGADVKATSVLQSYVECDVIASGGIGSSKDIEALAQANIRACVCGKALLSGAVSMKDALRAAQSTKAE